MTIKVEIKQDEDPISPREDFAGACLGRMYCWHPRYNLGDKKPDGYTPEDFEKEYDGDNSLMLPLVLLDHSGITIRVGNEFSCDPGSWDTSKVGWIVVRNDKVMKEYGTFQKDTALKCLRAEVEVYDRYLTGDVYGYVITRTTVCKHCKQKKEEVVDSCWGFYGTDVKKNGMLENIPKKYRKALEEASTR